MPQLSVDILDSPLPTTFPSSLDLLLKPPGVCALRKLQWTSQLPGFRTSVIVCVGLSTPSISNVEKDNLVVTMDVGFPHSLGEPICQRGTDRVRSAFESNSLFQKVDTHPTLATTTFNFMKVLR